MMLADYHGVLGQVPPSLSRLLYAFGVAIFCGLLGIVRDLGF